eukprot:COSAG02_NODE_6222_length_3716_cov_741.328449_1_plen_89_part_00
MSYTRIHVRQFIILTVHMTATKVLQASSRFALSTGARLVCCCLQAVLRSSTWFTPPLIFSSQKPRANVCTTFDVRFTSLHAVSLSPIS